MNFYGATGTAVARNMNIFSEERIAADIDAEGGNGVFRATRYEDSSNAPMFFGRNARGTRAASSGALARDTLIGFRGCGHTATDFPSGAAVSAFLLQATETFVQDSANGSQSACFTTQNGTMVQTQRLTIADNGDLHMDGANTVNSASRSILGVRVCGWRPSALIHALRSSAAMKRMLDRVSVIQSARQDQLWASSKHPCL